MGLTQDSVGSSPNNSMMVAVNFTAESLWVGICKSPLYAVSMFYYNWLQNKRTISCFGQWLAEQSQAGNLQRNI